MPTRTRVTIWNEFKHEKRNPLITEIYPQGMHEAIATQLADESYGPEERRELEAVRAAGKALGYQKEEHAALREASTLQHASRQPQPGGDARPATERLRPRVLLAALTQAARALCYYAAGQTDRGTSPPDDDPRRRPHSPQGDRPHRRPGQRAAKAGSDRRRKR